MVSSEVRHTQRRSTGGTSFICHKGLLVLQSSGLSDPAIRVAETLDLVSYIGHFAITFSHHDSQADYITSCLTTGVRRERLQILADQLFAAAPLVVRAGVRVVRVARCRARESMAAENQAPSSTPRTPRVISLSIHTVRYHVLPYCINIHTHKNSKVFLYLAAPTLGTCLPT